MAAERGSVETCALDNGQNGSGNWTSWELPPSGAGDVLPPGAGEPQVVPTPPAAPQRAPQQQRRVMTLEESNRGQPPPPHSHLPPPSGAAALPLGAGAPMTAYPPRPAMPFPRQLGQPVGGEQDAFTGHMLGASTVMVGAGSLLGAHFGGLYGGIAGALFAGSALNTLRAANAAMKGDPAADKEARISGVYAAIAAAMGGFILWKFRGRSPMKRNPSGRKTTRNERRDCNIRPIGP